MVAGLFWRPSRVGESRYELRATAAGCVGPADHQMYMGGATTAGAIEALEDAAGKRIAWASAQFLGRTMLGDRIDISLDLHPGRTITQATATLQVEDRVISVVRAALGSGDRLDASMHYTRFDPPTGPGGCPPKHAGPWATTENLLGLVERRVALDDPDAGREQLWMRFPSHEPAPASQLAILAEFMPGAHPHTQGGSGLDLTIRFIQERPAQWVLLDTQLVAASNGLFHSTARLFAETGELLATAQQTGRLPPAPQLA